MDRCCDDDLGQVKFPANLGHLDGGLQYLPLSKLQQHPPRYHQFDYLALFAVDTSVASAVAPAVELDSCVAVTADTGLVLDLSLACVANRVDLNMKSDSLQHKRSDSSLPIAQ